MADAASWAAHATDILALGCALVGYALLRGAPAALLERARSLRVWASGAMMSFALGTFMRPGTALQWTAVVIGGAFAALLLLTFGASPVEAAESSNEQPARRDR